jgi:hypothetical protein
MNSLLIALALLAQDSAATPPATSAPASAVAPAARTLTALPGVTISYHDIGPGEAKGITKALKGKKALDAKSQQLLAGKTDWTLGATTVRRKTGDQCTITSATPTFSAKVDLPRLAQPQAIAAADMPAWTDFLTKLEADAAAKLWFVHDRLPSVQTALVGKDCDQAMKDGEAAIAQIRAGFTALQPGNTVATPAPAPSQSN